MQDSITVVLLYAIWHQTKEPNIVNALGFSLCLITLTWITKRFDKDGKNSHKVFSLGITLVFMFLSLVLVCFYPSNQGLTTIVHEMFDWIKPIIDETKPIIDELFA